MLFHSRKTFKKTIFLRDTRLFFIILLLSTPFITFAAPTINFETLVTHLLDIIQLLVPLVITLAVLAFFWGVARYILSAGNAEKRAEGAKFMVYGVISLFVIVSVWGLVGILQYSLFGGSAMYSQLPQIPTP